MALLKLKRFKCLFQVRLLIFCIIYVSLLFFVFCRPKLSSNFGVREWVGYDLAYKQIRFDELKTNGLVLNFYSPICLPCLAELPALEQVYERLQKKNIAMYIALSSQLSINGIEATNVEKMSDMVDEEIDGEEKFKLRHKKIAERMKKDQRDYKILIPIIVMYDDFKIASNELVQATPETLLFKTKPLRLRYNFIGPLSTAKSQKALLEDSRFNFALSKLENFYP